MAEPVEPGGQPDLRSKGRAGSEWNVAVAVPRTGVLQQACAAAAGRLRDHACLNAGAIHASRISVPDGGGIAAFQVAIGYTLWC